MKYSAQEVIQYVNEEDVKFIRLAFCDIYGKQKNISIMPGELERAFEFGIAFDASSIEGFADESHSDLFLHPDPATLSILPWRPDQGRVVRMFCNISYPDGTPFEKDTRGILQNAIAKAAKSGISFAFGPEMEFYLFKLDEHGNPTKEPYDDAGYMDIAPEDKGENVRREICLTLEQMSISPESSHHEEGPGQNEIDFKYSDPLTSADNAMTFQTVVKTIAGRNGLYADFSPKPLPGKPGNGFHINISVKDRNIVDPMPLMIAGILRYISDITLFLNPANQSYERFGQDKAPRYVSWSSENRSPLIRIPAANGEYKRAELRSPDPLTNPYLAFALLIHAALEGIENKLYLPHPTDFNLYSATPDLLSSLATLPSSRKEAALAAKTSTFVSSVLPRSLIDSYCENK